MEQVVQTSHKEINSASILDLLLKRVTLSLQVVCIAIQNVHVGGVNVNVLEEVFPHVRVVALWVVIRDACQRGRGM